MKSTMNHELVSLSYYKIFERRKNKQFTKNSVHKKNSVKTTFTQTNHIFPRKWFSRPAYQWKVRKKDTKFTAMLFFRQINSKKGKFFSKTLIWRKICEKNWGSKVLPYMHSLCIAQSEKMINLLSLKKYFVTSTK